MVNLLIEKLKKKNKPRVLFFCDSRRHEGIILSVDEEYIEFYDPVRCYRRFFKITKIDELELIEDGVKNAKA